jgi:hypothetical protein
VDTDFHDGSLSEGEYADGDSQTPQLTKQDTPPLLPRLSMTYREAV